MYLYIDSNNFDLIPKDFTGTVITGLGDKIPFINGQTGCFSTVMYSFCIYCGKYLGCKNGKGVFGNTNDMCKRCFNGQMED